MVEIRSQERERKPAEQVRIAVSNDRPKNEMLCIGYKTNSKKDDAGDWERRRAQARVFEWKKRFFFLISLLGGWSDKKIRRT